MDANPIADCVIDQFNRAVSMFRKAVCAFPEEEWRKGDTSYLRPVGSAYHVVETLHFYTANLPADQFLWGQRFGVDWEDPDGGKFPSQEQLLEYLEEIWDHARIWMGGNDLMQKETLFKWTGSTLLSRTMYTLRHIQHHTAEMALELTKRGFGAPEWE